MTFENNQSKKNKTSKTKGSVLSASLVFKKPSFSNKNLTPQHHKTNTTKQIPQNKYHKTNTTKKRNQQRENPLLERRERIRS
ncbi:hypothetical protein [Helicobacter pylori]|uniref:hypothetical protein n=1 Tax=Helicobacter pylori TaxID=210 RepID=UPI0013E2D9AE|nr:hypothetical protein [Helicobacter pylori]